jgi:dienelactone hydrolase
MAWLTKGTDNKGGHQVENIDPVVESTIKAMRSELGITSVAAAGYCLGAKYVVRFLRPGLIDVGFGAHPSFVDVEELNAMTGPLSIAAAEHDEIFPAEKRRLTEDTLLAHKEKLPYQISLFSGTSHGFAVRGDTTIKQVAFAKRSAFVQAVQWFEEYL